MKILLAGGGTAGHINPAIAIAKYIKEKEPNSEFLFVGTKNGLEKSLVPREGFEIRFIEVMGLRRKLTLENMKVLTQFISSCKESKRIIDSFKPDVVIGTGGYVCAPIIYAATKRKIPTIIHEQNVFPGLAIKMFAKKADITAISFAETEKLIKAKKIVLTGNPLRPNLFNYTSRRELSKEMGFLDESIVLMFGGSLGSDKLNNTLVEMLSNNAVSGYNLIAATGERNYNKVIDALKERGIHVENMQNVKVIPYIYNMEKIFGGVDLIVSRAGAITISEINALGKAAILIPSPNVAHNHQEYNARYLEKNGAAKVILESELSGKTLGDSIHKLLSNKAALSKMEKESKALGIIDACDKIYNKVLELVK